jgi:hypothetical protein
MKITKVTIALLLSVLISSSGAMAESASKVEIVDGKNIEITDISISGIGMSDRTFKMDELSNGVYIVVSGSIFDAKKYPNAEEAVKRVFTRKGIKISENIDGSSLMLKLYMSGSLSMSDADKKAAHSNLPNTTSVVVNGAIVAGGLVANGPSALVGAATGLLFNVDSKSTAQAMIIMQPKKFKGFFGEGIKTSVDNGDLTNNIAVKYKLEKDNEAGDDVVLTMLTEQWIKKFIPTDESEPKLVSQ